MLALFLRAADPLLGAALLLDAAALSLLGAVALSLGALVAPPWRGGALPWLRVSQFVSVSRYPYFL